MGNSMGDVAMESGRFCGAPEFQLKVAGVLSLAIFLPLMKAANPSSYCRRKTSSSMIDTSATLKGMRM